MTHYKEMDKTSYTYSIGFLVKQGQTVHRREAIETFLSLLKTPPCSYNFRLIYMLYNVKAVYSNDDRMVFAQLYIYS